MNRVSREPLKRVILALMLLALVSCGDATGPNSDTMSALIDGDPFVATLASAERWGAGSGTSITLEGDDENFRGIGIDFFEPGELKEILKTYRKEPNGSVEL